MRKDCHIKMAAIILDELQTESKVAMVTTRATKRKEEEECCETGSTSEMEVLNHEEQGLGQFFKFS